jgi:biopolymer transport protein ExbB/TolQ
LIIFFTVIFIWCIIAISIAALVISIERFWMLKIRYRISGRQLFDTVKRNLIEGNIRGAEEACEEFEGIPLAQLLRSGISAATRRGRKAQLDIAVESELLNYIPMISQRLNYLPSLANVATLFGLLGTIAGLILAFKSTGGMSAAGMTQEQGLAAGIAVAMYNTAFGLLVAIPTTLSYLYLSNTANALMDDLDRYAAALKRLVMELGFIEARAETAELDEEAVAENSKPAKKEDRNIKVTQAQAQDRLERAQREVARESKTPNHMTPVDSKRPDKTIILDVDSRISVTQAVRPKENKKPYSEETAKFMAHAGSEIPAMKSERFASEPTQITTREKILGLDDLTDELRTSEAPHSRKPRS